MLSLLTPFRPRRAISEMRSFMRGADRDHLIGGVLAVLITGIIVVIFLVDSKVNTAPPRTVQYVEIVPEGRTDAEIIERQEREQREIEERAKARQQQFKEIDEALERAGI